MNLAPLGKLEKHVERIHPHSARQALSNTSSFPRARDKTTRGHATATPTVAATPRPQTHERTAPRELTKALADKIRSH